jgi:hypothetical protein
MDLTTKQTKALDYLQDNTTKEVLFGGCFEYPGTRWVMGRSELKSLKETTLNTFFEVCSMMGLHSGKHYQYNSVSGFIQIGQSQILLKDLKHYPSDPNYDSLGSLEITGAFIDECNQLNNIKAKEVLKSRIRYKLDDYGLLPKILMTCNPAKNWVYTDFYKPWKDNTLPTEKKFVQALATDNPYISKHYIDNLRTLDKNSQERLLHGNWEYDNDPAKLFEYESLTDMFTNEHAEAGKKYLTVDVARFGQDKTVIIEWDGLRAVNIRIIQQNSIESLVNEIKDISRVQSIPRSAILVDEDGVGGGVVDFLKCKGFVNGSKAIKERGRDTNFSNLKSQCYFKLAEYVNNSKIFVSCIQDVKELLIEELEVVKAKDIDKDNKLAVEGKDKVKDLLGRSPDISDALMMRMYFEINKTTTRW